MKPPDVYVNLDEPRTFSLAGLDADERRLLARLRRRAETHPDWTDFDNYWMRVLAAFYDARGLSRKQSSQTVPFQIAQDLSSRLGVAAGLVRPDDYLGDLEELIREKFPSQRAFCQAAGLSEDVLRPVLAGRQDLSLGTLTKALGRIGCTLRVKPIPEVKTVAGRKKRTG